jgi:hypothetical protein
MATFAQREVEAQELMAAGLGLVAIALVDRDIILVKSPEYVQPGSPAVVVWKEHAGGTTHATFGVS